MKSVIISGVSRGLGHEIANLFAKNDWKVIGTGRSVRPGDLNENVDYHQFDGSDRAACASFFESIKNQELDDVTLINNAGGFAGTDLKNTVDDDWEQMIKTNYLTGVRLTEAAVKTFTSLRIFNIISTAALQPSPHASAYGASKAAAKQFFQSLQKELKGDDYKITNIYPDMIGTYGNPPQGIKPEDLARFIFWQANQPNSFYMKDVTLATIK